MQSMPGARARILAWEQIDLPNGVYQVRNARWLNEMPDLTGWVDCSHVGGQVTDEIETALEMLGETMTGVWACWGNTVAAVCHGVAWMI